jgi:hypothetical protein
VTWRFDPVLGAVLRIRTAEQVLGVVSGGAYVAKFQRRSRWPHGSATVVVTTR